MNLLYIPILLVSFSSLFPMANGFDSSSFNSKNIAATLSLYNHQSELVSQINEIRQDVSSDAMSNQISIKKTLHALSFKSKDLDIEVPNYLASRTVRSIEPKKLAAIINSGDAYLTFDECSDGNYAVDLHGRIRGGGLLGAALGAAIGYIVIPFVIVVPSATALYAAKAVIHLKGGPEAGALFQQTVIDNTLPKIVDFAVRMGDVASPAGIAIGGIVSGPL